MNKNLVLPIFAIVATAAVSFGLQSYAQSSGGWVGATAAPPGNNASAPLDTSSNPNTKAGPLTIGGGLLVNTGGAANGLIVQSGNSTFNGPVTATGYTVNTGSFYSSGNGGILNLGATNWVDPGSTGAAIITDNNNYKALMIVGNNVSGNSGMGREVKVWDYLNVQGSLNATSNITSSGNIGSYGKSPTAGLPSGWAGGLHTWDVYAEGTIGSGPSGGPAAAYINNAGTVGGNKICLGGNCITSWPTTTSVACNQDGYIYSVPENYMNDWGGSNVNDSLEIYCRNHIARFCLSGENCPWRGDITSDDGDTCSASGLTSTGSGGNDQMAQVWGYEWQNNQNYYCVPDYSGAAGGQIQYTAPNTGSAGSPSGGTKPVCRSNCPVAN